MEIRNIPIDEIHPYENNPRNNKQSISKVAESIKAFGFLQPIVCDRDGVILAGHTRYAAARQLGLDTVPVLYADELPPEKAKEFRIVDNKVSESSKWDVELLCGELESIAVEDTDFNPSLFGLGTETARSSWHSVEKRCGLKKKITLREKNGSFYTTFFATGKEGRRIDEIKEDASLVPLFAENLCLYLRETLGDNLTSTGWCICTTPRRRHKDAMHFATAICEAAAERLGIPFRPDILSARNRSRIDAEITLDVNPPEPNIILFDDIVTTGSTMKISRDLLTEAGHTVLSVAAIRNQ